MNPLQLRLAGLRRHLRWIVSVRGGCWALGFLVLSLALAGWLDWRLDAPRILRILSGDRPARAAARRTGVSRRGVLGWDAHHQIPGDRQDGAGPARESIRRSRLAAEDPARLGQRVPARRSG